VAEVFSSLQVYFINYLAVIIVENLLEGVLRSILTAVEDDFLSLAYQSEKSLSLASSSESASEKHQCSSSPSPAAPVNVLAAVELVL